MTARDEDRRDRRTGPRADSASTSLVVRETRSPVPARSTVDRGSADDPVHELLAQLGEDLLAEHERRRAARTRSARSARRPRRRAATARRSTSAICAVLRPVSTSRPTTARRGQAGHRGERVQADDEGQLPAVPPEQAARVRPHGRPCRRPGAWPASAASAGQRHQSSSLGSRRLGRPGWCAAARRWVPRAATMPSCRNTHAVGVVEQQRAGGHDDGRSARPAPRPGGRRCAPRCARRRRWSARRAPASRPGEQGPGQREALALTAGQRAAALLDLAVETVGERVEHVARRSADATAAAGWRRRRSAPHGSSSSRSVPVNSRGSVSLTTTRRRTVSQRQVEQGRRRAAEADSGGVPPNRPSRSASAAGLLRAARTPRRSAGRARRRRRCARRRAARPAAARPRPGPSGWSRWSGCTASTRISLRGTDVRPGDTGRPNSVAVRSGITRNAAYP